MNSAFNISFEVFRFILVICLLLSFFMYLFKNLHSKERNKRKYDYIVFIGALVAMGMFFGEGIKSLLYFIPKSWGSFNEDMEFITMRETIGYLLGIAGAIIIVAILEEKE